jgi:DNA-binding CsgD family transcriptional regulator
MQTGNSVIIHSSPIVQQGLKSILLSRGIGIRDVMHACPDGSVIAGWKETLILADVQHAERLRRHARTLAKNGNVVAGIADAADQSMEDTFFSAILNMGSSLDSISRVLTGYLSALSDAKSDSQLSVRETEVLTMVAQGLSNKQIAGKLFISIHTVISHRKNITYKLGVKSISGLTLYAALNNLVDFQR